MAAAKLNLHFNFAAAIPANRPLKPTFHSPKRRIAVPSTPGRCSTHVLNVKASKEPAKPSKTRVVIMGAASLGLALLLMGFEDHRAAALGPEGPLMEEFWDNMRRYGLYVLTVSSGAIYTLLQPIVELLKNPLSAVLVVAIVGGGFFLVSQVVTAMVGLSDFSYEYSY